MTQTPNKTPFQLVNSIDGYSQEKMAAIISFTYVKSAQTFIIPLPVR